MRTRFVLVGPFLALLASACGAPPPGELIRSEKARLSAETVPQEDVRTAALDTSDFGFNLYRQVRQEQAGNLIVSPHSLSTVLTMTYAGARGQTETQMAQALHLSLPQERAHAAQNALDAALASRGATAKRPFVLRSINSLWGQKDMPLQPAFLDVLAENYGAGLRVLDFQRDTERSRQAINAWVEEETRQRIKDLLPQGSITPTTRLVLTNAVYFNATWQNPFDKAATGPLAFHRLDGNSAPVPMMGTTKPLRVRYVEQAGVRVVELPYDGGELSMLLLIPERGAFATTEANLSAEMLNGLVSALQVRSVSLRLPRFELNAEVRAVGPLKQLGMVDAFTEAADLSGINGQRDLAIAEVIQKTFVRVDEEGTEAAAASGVVVGPTSAPTADVQVVVDRPFFFLIRDNATGLPLFFGGVVNPAG